MGFLFLCSPSAYYRNCDFETRKPHEMFGYQYSYLLKILSSSLQYFTLLIWANILSNPKIDTEIDLKNKTFINNRKISPKTGLKLNQKSRIAL